MSIQDDHYCYVLPGNCAVGTAAGDSEDDGDDDGTTNQVKDTNLQVSTSSRSLKSNITPAEYVRNPTPE